MISVIIPLYNKGIRIQRTINSVLEQECEDMEIVVVDDGSTDDSAKYVNEFNSNYIKYYNKQNGGVSSARNYGIEKSSGQWLYFLDADDELLPGALKFFEKMIRENKDCKYFVGNMLWNGNSVSPDDAIIKTKNTYYSLWRNKLYPCPRNMVVHKSLIEKYGKFDERMSFFEDWDFSLRMAKCGKIVYSNHLVAKYNQEADGLSGKMHQLTKEMAYYIPEMYVSASFWYRALLCENVEFMLANFSDDILHKEFYIKMRSTYFSGKYAALHWLRQKLINKKII